MEQKKNSFPEKREDDEMSKPMDFILNDLI